MKNKTGYKWLFWSVIILVVLNISALSGLWYYRFERRPHPPPPPEKGGHLEALMARELGLTEKQVEALASLVAHHHQVTDSIRFASYLLAEKILDELFIASPDTVKMAALADDVGGRQAVFEKEVFRYFLELKALCRPDQHGRLESLLREMLTMSKRRPPPPRPHESPDGPPRRPHKEHRPPNRPE